MHIQIFQREHILEAPVLEPTVQAFLDQLAAENPQSLADQALEQARRELPRIQASVPYDIPADIHDMILPVGPTGEVAIRITRPQGTYSRLPVILYLHGGGWVFGDKQTHDRLVRELVIGTNAAVVFVEFTRSPEAHYPVAIEQAYGVACWIVEHGAQMNLDASHLAVVGDSAGGNMATVLTMLARDRQGPKINFQVLFFPTVDATNFETSSYEEYDSGYYLSRADMMWFIDKYVPGFAQRGLPTVSPLCASLQELKGLPPALIISGEYDVLRDEGEAYGRKLVAAGVAVTATRYLGAIHGFVLLNPLAKTPAARAAMAQANTVLRRALWS